MASTKVQLEIKCYFYMFAHNFLNISAMLHVKIWSYGEKHDGYFEDKSNAEICIVFNSQERQKCTFYLSSFESGHFDQK